MKRAALGMALALLGCGDDSATPLADPRLHARRTGGTLGEALQVSTLLGLFTVPVRLNGHAGPPMLVDTGAPLTFVTPGVWPGLGGGVLNLASLELGIATLFDVPAVGADPFGFGEALGGVLGVNVICQFPSTWDWQRSRFVLGPPPVDVAVEGPETVVPFRLRGGGVLTVNGAPVAVPPTRIVVEARIDDVPRTLVLDTGASTTALRDDLVEPLATDRRSLALRVITQGGVVTQRVLRTRNLGALGISRESLAVVGYARAGLDAVAREVGTPLDGLLGADFLRGHLLTIDYPAGQIRLRAYRDRSHVRDRWVRAGVMLGRQGTRWIIGEVLPGTDAATRGVPVGAELTHVEGRPLEGLDLDAVDALLLGSPGETRTLRSPRGEFVVTVEDVIPLRR